MNKNISCFALVAKTNSMTWSNGHLLFNSSKCKWPKSECQTGMILSVSREEPIFSVFSSSWNILCIPYFGHSLIFKTSTFYSPWSSCHISTVNTSCSLARIFVITLRSHWNNPGQSFHLNILNWIILTKSLMLYKVTSGFEGALANHLLNGWQSSSLRFCLRK